MAKKVTYSVETVMQNDGFVTLSDPIDVYAVADEIDEIYDKDFVSEAIEFRDTEKKNIVVFVKNVTDYSRDDYAHRGAYFLFEGKDVTERRAWREILIGPHVHANKEILDNFSNIVPGDLDDNDQGFVTVDKEGNFSLLNYSDILRQSDILPDLPNAILDYKKLLNSKNDGHHLDASLDELKNTYDWLGKDEDGVYRNVAYGNCVDLYKSLRYSSPLYLQDINGDVSLTKTLEGNGLQVLLETCKVNFSDEEVADTLIPSVYTLNTSKLTLNVDLVNSITENDEILVFRNGEFVHQSKCQKMYKGVHEILLILDKNYFSNEVEVMTFLILKNGKLNTTTVMDIKNAFENESIKLDEIDNELLKLYITDNLKSKKLLPRLYLSTDENGNISWENTLLPSQLFFTKSITVNADDLQNMVDPNNENNIIVEFKDIPYLVSEDFVMLMINDFFVYNVYPMNTDHIKFSIPKRNGSQYDLDPSDGEVRTITVLVIKNSANKDITDMFAKKFITKEDAINILSHGKLNLSDYVTQLELTKYSKTNHKHSEYANKFHNHDARYAAFQHTHPELFLALKCFISDVKDGNFDNTQLTEWVNELKSTDAEFITNYLEDALTHLDTENLIITDEEFIERFNNLNRNYDLNEFDSENGVNINTVLKQLLEFFERDTVLSNQVLLSKDIPVRLKNGNIGGIEKEITFKKGTTIETILQQILNPYINIDEARKKLTPIAESSYCEWYKIIGDEYVKVSEELEFNSTPDALYFKPVFINEFGKECSIHTLLNGEEDVELKVIPKEVTLRGNTLDVDDNGFYMYQEDFNFSKQENDYYPILVTYTTNSEEIFGVADKIYDNYGTPDDFIVDNFIYQPNFTINLPAYYIGTLANEDGIESKLTDNLGDIYKGLLAGDTNFRGYYRTFTQTYEKSEIQDTPWLLVIIRGDIDDRVKILDVDSDIAFKKFMKNTPFIEHSHLLNDNTITTENIKDKYICYYYNIKNISAESGLKINVSINQRKGR